MYKIFFLFFVCIQYSCCAIVLKVTDFGANGKDNKDDTQPFQICLNRLAALGGGTMEIPTGVYYISHLRFLGKQYSNVKIIGNGSAIFQVFPNRRKIIERWNTFSEINAADGCFIFEAGVSKQFDDRESIKNIQIQDLHFVSDVVNLGFDELSHQISAHGVSGFRVENCSFKGFLGDAIAINAGTDFKKNYGAYNKNVSIINCTFDGLNRDNRQGISFYYCDGFLVERCSFKNITRKDMPGAIDVEPMENWQVARNGIIRNCSFENIGGIGAIVLFLMPQSAEIAQKTGYGYLIENCVFDNVRTPLAVIGHEGFKNYNPAQPRITFKNSNVNNYVRIMDARNAFGVEVLQNNFTNVKPDFKNLFGNKNSGSDIVFNSNTFVGYLSEDVFHFSEDSKGILFINTVKKKRIP